MNKKQERLLAKDISQNNDDITNAISAIIEADITDYAALSGLDFTLTEQQKDKLLKIKDAALEPAPKDELRAWLETMWVLSPKDRERAHFKKEILDDYTDFLMDYPADVARAVTKEITQWFPAKLELQKYAEAKFGKRKLYLTRLD